MPAAPADPAAAGSEDRLQARRALRRRRLLDAALDLFASGGYHDTSVEGIVGAARTSKSAFYASFISKEDCLRELLAAEGGDLIQAVTAAALAGEDHRQRLRLGIQTFIRVCAARKRLARLLLVESIGISAGVEHVRHDLQGRFAAMVEDAARRAAQADPFYAAIDPVVFGRAVVGAVNEATGHFLSHSASDPEALAESLCQIFAPEAGTRYR